MDQIREDLLEELGRVRDTMLKMQSVLTEYIKLERSFRSRQASAGGSVKACQGWKVIILLGTLAGFTLLTNGAPGTFEGWITLTMAAAAVLVLWENRNRKSKLNWAALLLMGCYFADSIRCLSHKMNLFAAGLLGTVMALTTALEFFFIAGRDKRAAARSQKAERNNANVRAQRAVLYSRCQDLQKELNDNAPSWLPPDYYNLEAVEFLISAVQNNRAGSVKEFLRLFEGTAQYQEALSYQRRQAQQLDRLLNSQQAIQGEIRFANMMKVAGFIRAADIG